MYIIDLKAITPQLTYSNEFLEGKKVGHADMVYHVVEPDYMELIPKALLRRMGKAVRMGVGAGLPLVEKHKDLEGVLIGTANGGLEDCIKFLNQIVEYNEGVLTPTNFVQSTPNAIAGQLALMGENRGYNITYTNGGLAFENAVLDALLLMQEGAADKLLLGGIEEISDYNYHIDSLSDKYKKEVVSDQDLLSSETSGTVCGEGAAMFVVHSDPAGALAQIVDVAHTTYPVQSDLSYSIQEMLRRNGLTLTDVDTVMLGYNGDADHNSWYDFVGNELFGHARALSFKNLIGDYRTCSSVALWLGAHLLNGSDAFLPHIHLRSGHQNEISRILVYNHFDGVRHGCMLLSKVRS